MVTLGDIIKRFKDLKAFSQNLLKIDENVKHVKVPANLKAGVKGARMVKDEIAQLSRWWHLKIHNIEYLLR